MFRIGFWEIASILLVSIVFINPGDLPKIARKIGFWYGKVKKLMLYISDPAREFDTIIKEPIQELHENIDGTQ